MRVLLSSAVALLMLAACGGQESSVPPSRTAARLAAGSDAEVAFTGKRADYTITYADGTYTVTGAGVRRTYSAPTRLRFDDGMTALDTDGAAGRIYRLYRAAFDRIPDLGGLGYWIGEADGDMATVDVARQFIASDEFVKLYGSNPDDTRFLTLLYRNVLHRAPDDGGLAYWLDALHNGLSRAAVLASFSESVENRDQTAAATRAGIDYVPYAPGALELLAGSGITAGDADGKGSAARFWQPASMMTGPDGAVYVGDGDRGRIRRIAADGTVSTPALRTADERLADAPFALAMGSDGSVYMANAMDHTVLRYTRDGKSELVAGQPGKPGGADGTADKAELDKPSGVAVGSDGTLYVFSNGALRKIAPGTPRQVVTLAGTYKAYGGTDGKGSAARFGPSAPLAVDGLGNVYAADGHALRKITPAGVVTTVEPYRQLALRGVAVDRDNAVYVADTRTVLKYDAQGRRVATYGEPSTVGYVDGAAGQARFASLSGIAVDPQGTVYVSERQDSSIRTVSADGTVATLAGPGASPTEADGTGTAARFAEAHDVAVAGNGSLIVADRSTLRSVAPTGEVVTLGGMPGYASSNDGTMPRVGFDHPNSLAYDPAGTLYVSEAARLRKVGLDGQVVTFDDELVQFNAKLSWSSAHGGLLLGDYTELALVTFTASGPVRKTLWSATDASVLDAVADRAGNVYMSDIAHHVVRKLDREGHVTVVAGQYDRRPAPGAVVDEGLLAYPRGLALDSAGNLYIADSGNHVIRKLAPDGRLTIVAGRLGKAGLATGALPGGLFLPSTVTVKDDRTLIVLSGQNVVRIALPAR